MAFSHEIKFWEIREKKGRRRPSFEVRWVVGPRTNEKSKSFAYHAQADNWRAKLIRAARDGEGFDEETGLPESMLRDGQAVTWYELACRYVDLKWPHAAAKTRTSTVDALATVTPVLVTTTRGRPDPQVLRDALYGWAFNKAKRETGPPAHQAVDDLTARTAAAHAELEAATRRQAAATRPNKTLNATVSRLAVQAADLDARLAAARADSDAQQAAIRWLARHSRKVTALDERERRSALVRAALDALALQMDGTPAAATVVARKRAVFHGVLNYAVELDILPANPVDKVRWKAPDVADEVDRRVVANPAQVRDLLTAVDDDRPDLTAFFGCLYYALLRPGEAVALERANCADLPDHGWGRLVLSDSRPRAGSGWTDDGTSHDRRHLKHRAKKVTRDVPIPPELVRLLRTHLDRHGTTPDGRLFRGARGGPLSESVYGRAWQRARDRALTTAQTRSPLAARPYDLRHGGVTLALNADVPAPEIARRAGHGVEVLLRVYAGCIDGHEPLWNQRISDALTDPRPGAAHPAPPHAGEQPSHGNRRHDPAPGDGAGDGHQPWR